MPDIIRFLHAKGSSPAKFHDEIVSNNDEDVMISGSQ